MKSTVYVPRDSLRVLKFAPEGEFPFEPVFLLEVELTFELLGQSMDHLESQPLWVLGIDVLRQTWARIDVFQLEAIVFCLSPFNGNAELNLQYEIFGYLLNSLANACIKT